MSTDDLPGQMSFNYGPGETPARSGGSMRMKISPATRVIQLVSKMPVKERRELLKLLSELFSRERKK